MKKILSLVLILAMSLCLFAGCDDTPAANTGLEDAKTYLYAMYKDNSEVTAVDYTVVGVVMIDGVAYNVTWTADNESIKITAADKFYNIDVPDTLEEITYTLTATVSDAEGNSLTQSFTYKVPAAAGLPTSIADGTYVILACGNLTMSSLAEDKGYGYPYATEVTVADGTVSGHTAADVLTITNVAGGVTIQDAYGRYFYLKGTYNSFNVGTEAPAEGHVWEILKNGDDYIIVNAMNKKTLAYSTSYTSWGAYPELTDDHNSLLNIVAAQAPAACQHVEVVDAAVAATCTEDGLTEGTHCSECGEVLAAQEVVAAAGHASAAAVQENLVGGGCGEAGSYEEVVYCSVCNAEISRTLVEIPATGDHNYITELERKDPTCTEAGYVVMACSCGATQPTEIPATGHTEGEAVKENVVAATTTTEGSYDNVVYCTVCGAEVSRVTETTPVIVSKMYKIYYPDGQTYVTANPTDRNRLAAGAMADAAIWTVEIDENGYYIFSYNGQYMTSGETGNALYMADELTDCARWEVIECDGGVYLRNVGANYKGNYNQYMEFYYDFTTYGFKEDNAKIYTFQLIEVV